MLIVFPHNPSLTPHFFLFLCLDITILLSQNSYQQENKWLQIRVIVWKNLTCISVLLEVKNTHSHS